MTHVLYSLAVLACPAGMGLMMWMMMRGGKQNATLSEDSAKQRELIRLQAQIDELRAQQGTPATHWTTSEHPVGH